MREVEIRTNDILLSGKMTEGVDEDDPRRRTVDGNLSVFLIFREEESDREEGEPPGWIVDPEAILQAVNRMLAKRWDFRDANVLLRESGYGYLQPVPEVFAEVLFADVAHALIGTGAYLSAVRVEVGGGSVRATYRGS